jgi:hypothetical protein
VTLTRRALVAGALMLGVAVAFAAPSRPHAAPGQLTILDASKEATGYYGERRRRDAVHELDSLGVDVMRVIVYWVDVTPRPDAVRPPHGFRPRHSSSYGPVWTSLDRTVREAARHGIDVMLVPTGRFPNGKIPRWARRHPRRKTNEPRPRAFRNFVQAIGSRYSGRFDPDGRGPRRKLPPARFMALWNEPNSGAFLEPRERGPEIYRALVEAGKRGLDAAGWRGTVLAGETSQGGGNQTPPVEFMRRTLCLPPGFSGPPGCPRLPVNGWSHHPYSLGMTPWQVPADPDLVTSGSLERLTGPLARADALGALPANTGLFLTEYGYETVPDPRGVSFGTQAEFDAIAERIAYENPMVASFPQYLLRDDPPVDATFPAFESGLRTYHGRGRPCLEHPPDCKPAWYAFKTPLAVRIDGDHARIWGRVRPAHGSAAVEIHYADGDGGSGTLASLRTDTRGYFTLDSANVPGRRWWVRWGRHDGPTVQGYAYP